MKRIGVLLACLFLSAAWPFVLPAQNFNASFPRIGVVTFYDANVGEAIWRNHDLVVIRFYQNDLARRLKQQNPDVIVLAATDDLVDNDGVIAQLPEAWHTKKANGERVFAGEGWWLNVTRFCPRLTFTYGGKTYNNANASEFFAGYFQNALDWRYFDGVFFDSWANTIRYIGDEEYNAIDFDANGTADNAQGQGQHLADERWQEGNRLLISELRKRLPTKVFAAHEAGPQEADFLNGLGMEGWKGGAWSWVFTSLLGPFRSGNGPQPRVNFVEVAGAKDSFQRMRYGLATACMTGAYVGVDEGLWAHRYTYLYDEYIADLGQPLGEPQQISALGEVWVRYFDKGAVICNGSGRPQTVRAAHLTGGPYYKFQGGQVPAVNDGRRFESAALAGAGDQSSSGQEGDGIVLFRQPTVLVTDIVIDNEDINMTSPGNNPVAYQGA